MGKTKYWEIFTNFPTIKNMTKIGLNSVKNKKKLQSEPKWLGRINKVKTRVLNIPVRKVFWVINLVSLYATKS